MLLWLPQAGTLLLLSALGHPIPAPALQFDPDGWVDSSTGQAFYCMSIGIAFVAIYLSSTWLEGISQSVGRHSAPSEGGHGSNGVGAGAVGRIEFSTSSEGSGSSGNLVLDEVSLASRGSGFSLNGFGSDFNLVPDYRSWLSGWSDSSAIAGASDLSDASLLDASDSAEDLDERDVQSTSPRFAFGGFLQRGTARRSDMSGQL